MMMMTTMMMMMMMSAPRVDSIATATDTTTLLDLLDADSVVLRGGDRNPFYMQERERDEIERDEMRRFLCVLCMSGYCVLAVRDEEIDG
jgi:hypothetical protein